jgi:diaminopropionate ammonia-lyase
MGAMRSIYAMDILQNPHRHAGLTVDILRDIPAPSTDAAAVQALLARCPDAAET